MVCSLLCRKSCTRWSRRRRRRRRSWRRRWRTRTSHSGRPSSSCWRSPPSPSSSRASRSGPSNSTSRVWRRWVPRRKQAGRPRPPDYKCLGVFLFGEPSQQVLNDIWIVHCCPLQEISEPIHDLKMGIEDLRCSRTFRYVLAVLLTMGNFLNGVQVHTPYQCIERSILVGETKSVVLC